MKSGLKLSREQYGHLIKDIESSLKKHVTGGSFGAPDTVPELHDLQFWVSDPRFEGGGFFSSIGNAFKHVYKSLKSSGVIDKAKDAALKKGRELGGKAIAAVAKRVESEASKRGLDVSKLTAAAAGKAHEHLHEAEGFVSKKIDEGQSELEDKAGVSGSGHPRRGHGSVRGGAMYQSQGVSGSGMYETQGGSMYGQTYIRAPTTYGVPAGMQEVSPTHHLLATAMY